MAAVLRPGDECPHKYSISNHCVCWSQCPAMSTVQTRLGYIPWLCCAGCIWVVSMKEHCQFASRGWGKLMNVLLRHSCGQLGFSINCHTPFYTHIHYAMQTYGGSPKHGLSVRTFLFPLESNVFFIKDCERWFVQVSFLILQGGSIFYMHACTRIMTVSHGATAGMHANTCIMWVWCNLVYLLNLTGHKFDFTTQNYWSDQGRFPQLLSCQSVWLLQHSTHSQTNKITHKERDLTAISHALACLETRNSNVVRLSQGRGPNVYQAHEVHVRQVLSKKLCGTEKYLSVIVVQMVVLVNRLETGESGEVKK